MIYRNYFLVTPPDVLIEDDVTYVKVAGSPGLWPGIAYEEIEVLRAKGYDPDRSTKPNTGRRSGRPSQWASSRRAGSGYHFHTRDESGEYTPNPMTDGEAIHKLLEKWFGDERGMNDPRRQWGRAGFPVKGEDDGIRTNPRRWDVV